MISASGSFEDFMEGFKRRHPKDYGLDPTVSVAVKAPVVKESVKGPVLPVSVRTNVVVEEVSEWDGAEFVDSDEPDEYWK